MGRFRGSVRVSVKGYVGNREKLSKFSDRMPPFSPARYSTGNCKWYYCRDKVFRTSAMKQKTT